MIEDHTLVTARHVLCVLGSGLDLGVVDETAAAAGFELDGDHSGAVPDPRMPEAFEASALNSAFSADDRRAVRAHDTVAYLLSPPVLPGVAFALARRALALTAGLLRSGATAVKNESSGLAHGRDRWLALADDAAGADRPAAPLYTAWVKRPISDGALTFSCGMHLLGAPDIEVEAPGGTDPDALAELVDGLAGYLLTERRAQEIQDGEGFRLAPDAPRWTLWRHLCTRYADDDFFFNPQGYWRLIPA